MNYKLQSISHDISKTKEGSRAVNFHDICLYAINRCKLYVLYFAPVGTRSLSYSRLGAYP